MKVLVIGGGAAGFFSAINIAEKNPKAEVTILEKTSKLLTKVSISGGGRCNVTNGRTRPSELVQFYPRGQKKLHPLFSHFSTNDMVKWLNAKGVETKVEDDLRVFPSTNNSQTIIDCFVNEAFRLGVKIKKKQSVKAIFKREDYWVAVTDQEELEADKIVFATGSSPNSFKVLTDLGLKQTPLTPSLFTFNIDDRRLDGLPGVSFENTQIRVLKSKLKAEGPLLITHWGISGPGVLKLSAWGAIDFHASKYQFDILVNFVPEMSRDEVMNALLQQKQLNPKRQVLKYPQFGIPRRFWEKICQVASIANDQLNADLSKKQINKLTEEFTQGLHHVKGKSTFKEEFVTCGGIELSQLDLVTFECKEYKGLYLAGEVLNIDGLTGGFNFQACWSAGWAISEDLKSK
ncbi:MAG: NAD(P)/FAD-dependent oxidoreductase [Cyclobacteriaceae bacterium]